MVSSKFCAKCGKKGEFEDSVCPDCRGSGSQEKKTVEVCKTCGRWLDGVRWSAPPLPETEFHETVCPECARGPDRKEAIVQLRSRYIDDFFEEALDVAEKVVKKERTKGGHTFVKVKGHDLEFTNKKIAKKAADAIAKHFFVPVESSGKLVTYNHEKSKDVIRPTFLVRLPEVKVGDIVNFGKSYEVVRVGSTVTLKDESGHTHRVSHKDLRKYKLVQP